MTCFHERDATGATPATDRLAAAAGSLDADGVPVVAAVVRRDDRYLLGRRPARKRHGGLWEFPGGKVDEGESRLDAVRRELREELGVEVTDIGRRLTSIGDGASRFVIEFHEVEMRGSPSALEHSAVGWFTLEELGRMSLAPADRTFADALYGKPESDASPESDQSPAADPTP